MNLERPLPELSGVGAPFWQAARQHRLVAPKCKQCGKVLFYPRAICPFDWSSALEWVELSGHGLIYTYTVVRQPAHPAFAERVPYVLALIELAEGIRIMSNVVAPLEAIQIGMPVAVRFEDVDEEVSLPFFVPE